MELFWVRLPNARRYFSRCLASRSRHEGEALRLAIPIDRHTILSAVLTVVIGILLMGVGRFT
jgi:hypothetical protein